MLYGGVTNSIAGRYQRLLRQLGNTRNEYNESSSRSQGFSCQMIFLFLWFKVICVIFCALWCVYVQMYLEPFSQCSVVGFCVFLSLLYIKCMHMWILLIKALYSLSRPKLFSFVSASRSIYFGAWKEYLIAIKLVLENQPHKLHVSVCECMSRWVYEGHISLVKLILFPKINQVTLNIFDVMDFHLLARCKPRIMNYGRFIIVQFILRRRGRIRL